MKKYSIIYADPLGRIGLTPRRGRTVGRKPLPDDVH